MLSLYDHIFEPLIILNLQKKIVHFNPAFNIFSKQPPRILRGIEHFHQLFESADFDIENWLDQGFTKLELRVSPELQIQHVREKDLRSQVVLRQFPITLEDGTYIAVAFHDLSIEKNLYDKYRQQLEELRATHAQIIQADKLATLGEMTATISHEISNPLTIASGNSELIDAFLEMEDPKAVVPDLRKANNDIRESIDRIHNIIRNMKHFLWQSEDTKEFCSLSDAINNALEWLKSPIESSGTRIETLFRTQDTVVLANKLKMEQVVINLVKNAIDALEETQTKDPTVTIELLRSPEDHALILKVKDNGPGLPEIVKENLFKPFTTTKKVGLGTGLGLSISQKIIESHQGQIEVEPCEVGATFKVRLPTIEGYSFTRGDKVSRGLSSKQGPRILIVDNEPQILNVLSRFLEDEGYHVIASTRPHEAIKFMSKMDVNLILTDLNMPEMTGHDLAKELRMHNDWAPILYMSSSKNTDAYNRDKESMKIAGMLVKPFSRDEVVRTVKDALGSKK
ncbi:MAG: response regulator [Bacteriovoracaceae bacterium]|nr:response regulator [Bacteriovoracaceae bacterium]